MLALAEGWMVFGSFCFLCLLFLSAPIAAILIIVVGLIAVFVWIGNTFSAGAVFVVLGVILAIYVLLIILKGLGGG